MRISAKQRKTWLLISLLALILVACSPETDTAGFSVADSPTAEPAVAQAESTPGDANAAEETSSTDETESQDEPDADEAPTEEAEDTAEPTSTTTSSTDEAASDLDGVSTIDDRSDGFRQHTAFWDTNWNLHSVNYTEFRAGGPPRDGIPPIDFPTFVSQEEAAEWLAENEPVMALEIDGDARAYPLQILVWHEIVNDTVGDIPVVVTYCPLCNSALTFDRRVDGEEYTFGTSGLLRNFDLVMWDRTTESLWQQFTGEGIVGDLTGAQLTFLPSSLISFADFKAAYPDGIVLSKETGVDRAYGVTPYANYDQQNYTDFEGLPATERVVTVSLDDVEVAYPFPILAEAGVIHDNPGDQELVIFHLPGTSSAMGAQLIAEGEDVGATGVFDPHLDGQKLTFSTDGLAFTDEESGSTWNIVGQAIDGPLAGEQLTPIVHGDHFWFSWVLFKPDTIVYE